MCSFLYAIFSFQGKKISKNVERRCFFKKKKKISTEALLTGSVLFSFLVIVYTVSDELMTSSCGKTLIMANEKGCVLVNCNRNYSVYHVYNEHFTGGLH